LLTQQLAPHTALLLLLLLLGVLVSLLQLRDPQLT
jgi:hypothetical protein